MKGLRDKYHQNLANYFYNLHLYLDKKEKKPNTRKLAELPWQQTKAEMWDELWKCLNNLDFFRCITKIDELDIYRFWSKLLQKSNYSIENAYKSVVKNPIERIDVALTVAELFLRCGYPKTALLIRHIINIFNLGLFKVGKIGIDMLSGGLREEAQALRSMGELSDAIDLLKTAEKINRDTGDLQSLIYILIEMSTILLETGQIDYAMKIVTEGEQISRALDNKLLVGFLSQKAMILKEKKDFNSALKVLDEAERIARSINKLRLISSLMGHKALIYRVLGKFRVAWEYHEKEIKLSREIHDSGGLESALFGQANILIDLEEYSKALELLQKAEQISTETGNINSLAKCYGGMATVYRYLKDFTNSKYMHEKEEKLFKKNGNTQGLVISQLNLAILLFFDLEEKKMGMKKALCALKNAKEIQSKILIEKATKIIEEIRT